MAKIQLVPERLPPFGFFFVIAIRVLRAASQRSVLGNADRWLSAGDSWTIWGDQERHGMGSAAGADSCPRQA